LFANHSVCNAASVSTSDEAVKDLKALGGTDEAASKANKIGKKKAFLCKKILFLF
jgi:hypothetical protein